MKFETRRERELRRKRQKRSAILGMVFAILVVIGLGILLWNGRRILKLRMLNMKKYHNFSTGQVNRNVQMNLMNTKNIYRLKFVEEVAKDKFGLVYLMR
ncbi:MAG: hypothetical protein ACLT33_12965 [Lachnospira pectinoschiza]